MATYGPKRTASKEDENEVRKIQEDRKDMWLSWGPLQRTSDLYVGQVARTSPLWTKGITSGIQVYGYRNRTISYPSLRIQEFPDFVSKFMDTKILTFCIQNYGYSMVIFEFRFANTKSYHFCIQACGYRSANICHSVETWLATGMCLRNAMVTEG